MKKGLLHKFLNNRCTSEELQEVIDWVKIDALNKDGESINYQEWNKYAGEEFSSDKVRMDGMLDKIHHQINIGQNRILERTTKSVSMLTWITRVAAVLLLPVLLILSYVISQPFHFANTFAHAKIDSVEIIAPIGSKTNVQLEDGTMVYLNHGSRLTYPQKFIGKSREVQLIGEGYFEVAHNPQKPFIVKVDNIRVKALGTSFNVMAYPEEQVLETTLVEGKVVIEQENRKGKFVHLEEMKPGQNMCINVNTNTFNSTYGEVEKYTSWKEGKLIFKNESITQIARRLSRWYNVDIQFADNHVENYTYTATFVDETIYQILDLMVLATPIYYKSQTRKKMPDGTFSKQKITIGIKK